MIQLLYIVFLRGGRPLQEKEISIREVRRSRISPEDRAKKRRRRRIRNAIIAWTVFIALVLLILFGIAKFTGFISGLFKEEFTFSYTACEDWSECESMSVVKKDYAVGVQYPIINNKTDRLIEKEVQEMIDAFTAEIKAFERGKGENRAVYTVSYSATKNSDRYVSLVYTISRVNPMREINDIQYRAGVYDIAEGRRLSADEIFDGEFAGIASNYVVTLLEADPKYVAETTTTLFTENTKPKLENFENFGFTDSSVRIYFGSGDIFPTDIGALTVDIPLSRLYANMIINVSEYEPPKYDANAPMIALTFDDGPLPEVTERILTALESVGGRATFFLIGERISRGKDVIRRGNELGCEYGNHTWGHIDLSNATNEEIALQFSKTDDALKEVIGKKCSLVRAPYAATNDEVLKIAARPFIGWSIDTLDWDTRNTEAIKEQILSKVSDGDILLMHDLYSETAAAVEQVIPLLVQQGYQLVTVSELLEARSIPAAAGKIYHNAPR